MQFGDLSFGPEANGNGHVAESIFDGAEHLNNTRTQEIMGKAVSGMLLLLLKWFRVSRELHQGLLDNRHVADALQTYFGMST